MRFDYRDELFVPGVGHIPPNFLRITVDGKAVPPAREVDTAKGIVRALKVTQNDQGQWVAQGHPRNATGTRFVEFHGRVDVYGHVEGGPEMKIPEDAVVIRMRPFKYFKMALPVDRATQEEIMRNGWST
jgi:hypothetical protein